MNASSSSFPAVVENDGEVTLEAGVELSIDSIWSMATAPHVGMAEISNKPRIRLIASPMYECTLRIRAAGNMVLLVIPFIPAGGCSRTLVTIEPDARDSRWTDPRSQDAFGVWRRSPRTATVTHATLRRGAVTCQ